MGNEHKKIIEAIDNELKELQVNEVLKDEILYKCSPRHKTKTYSKLRVASLFLIVIFMVSIGNKDVLATIKNIFIYTPLKNQVIPLDSPLYQLENPITVTTEEGYIKVVGCELKDSYLELKLNSDIGRDFKEWKESIKIIDTQGKEYNLYTNVVGMGRTGKEQTEWTIEVSGDVGDLKPEFKIITPFETIPIQCTLAQELNTIDEIGESTYDQGIYITARKEQEGENTAVILTAFNKKQEQIQASYKMKAYNKEGKEIELDYGRGGKYYFPASVDQIASVEISSVSEIKSVKDKKVWLKVPNKDGIQYNKQLEFEEATVEIVDGCINNNILQIRTRIIDSSEGQIEDIRYDIEGSKGYQLNRDGAYQTMEIVLDEDLPNNIKVKMTHVDVKKDGKWKIIF